VEAVLAGSTIPWGRYRTFREVAQAAADQAALPIFTMLDQPGVGTHPAAGSPLRVDDGRRPATPAPILGADSEDVLRELGWESGDIAALVRAGIVGEGIG
jgi:2-methylfumaryl-CoA isomerase